MRRRTHDADAARREVDHEHREEIFTVCPSLTAIISPNLSQCHCRSALAVANGLRIVHCDLKFRSLFIITTCLDEEVWHA
jgi:hypothetical protein